MRSQDYGGTWSTDGVPLNDRERRLESGHNIVRIEEGYFDALEGSMPISAAMAHGFHFLGMLIVMITVSVILLMLGVGMFLKSLEDSKTSGEFLAFSFLFTSCGFSALLAALFGASVKMISDGVASGINNSDIAK